MRSDDGKLFQHVVGVTDRNVETGEEFAADTLKTNKPLAVGENIEVGGKVYQYRGEDSLGCSIFTSPGQHVLSARFGK
ncbi:MAG: hypothetical protein WAN14_03330 [Candidatus Acidiferrales bacterium]